MSQLAFEKEMQVKPYKSLLLVTLFTANFQPERAKCKTRERGNVDKVSDTANANEK